MEGKKEEKIEKGREGKREKEIYTFIPTKLWSFLFCPSSNIPSLCSLDLLFTN